MKIVRQKLKSALHLKDVMYANHCRKMIIKFGVYLVILFITLLIGIVPNIIVEEKVIHQHVKFVTDLKYILMWKTSKKNKKNFINHDLKYSQGQSEFIKQNCPYINCYITYNKSMMKQDEFDAVVFNVHDIIKVKTANLTIPRSNDQIYIFKSFDSAERHILCKSHLDDFFNWTWTYKLDSDIPHPFFTITDKTGIIIGPKKNMTWNYEMKNNNKFKSVLNKKNKALALIMNNCQLKIKHGDFLRDFTAELKGYNFTIDIYGPCGKNRCGKSFNNSGCNQMIDKEYFFQLVLEDSFSPDYVSEKVAKAMNRLAIPIIVGGSNYSSFLPPGSYINANAFVLKNLAAIMEYLIRDKAKYSFFFDWKQYYKYKVSRKDNVCDLCKKMNEKDSEQKTYKEFRKWWNSDYEDVCERLKISKIFHLDY